tara:strand:+ start:53 stop:790 length:738 start_codon:yes stop_codon:yes gene_type:complete
MKNSITQAVILAAGMGSRLKELNKGLPKGFIRIGGVPIIEHSVKALLAYGIEEIIIVTGYMNEHYENFSVQCPQIKTVRNEKFSETGTMYSLWCAQKLISSDFILLESDLIFEAKAIQEIIESPYDDCILISGKTEAGDEVFVTAEENIVKNISKDRPSLGALVGEFVGISKISNDFYKFMIQMAEDKFQSNLKSNYDTDCFVAVSDIRQLSYLKIENLLWAEIDNEAQLNNAYKVWERIIKRNS